METFEILVKLTTYKKINVQAEDINSAKSIVALQLNSQKQNFEFIDIQDAEICEAKPELLMEEQLSLLE